MASKITDRIAAYMEDFPREEGISLYHCEFVKEGPDRYLRVYIDVDEEGRYVSTDDCEKVSKFLEERLDAEKLKAVINETGYVPGAVSLEPYEKKGLFGLF